MRGRLAGTHAAALTLLASLLSVGCAATTPPPFELVAQAYEIHVEGAAPIRQGGLVVASYNLRQMIRPDSLHGDLATLSFVDVWALQEVPVPKPPDGSIDEDADHAEHRAAFCRSMQRILPPGTWHVRAVAANARAPDGWATEGQVVASRLPIRHAEVWPLGGAPKRRAALAVVIDHPAEDGEARPIVIANTDHEPSFASHAAGNDAQVRRLVGHLSRFDAPTVVAGDFNPTGLLWRLRSHPQDVARLHLAMLNGGFASAGHDVMPTFRGGGTSMRLDHLFLRDLRWVAGGVETSALGSDHLPVWCRVEPIPLPTKDEFGCAGS